MKRLMILGAVCALAVARPDLYKEKEDFQFSRTSTDEGSKSGFYGAQRGNMGGNYERAHNMDSLAQNQMSGLVRQVEGELGDGARTKTGSVYTAANSRGTYGSGHFDLSNLSGRNFQEGTSFGDSLSQSSLSAASAYNAAYANSRSQSSRHSGYQAAGHSGVNLQSDDLQTLDNTQGTGQYDYGRQTSHAAGYNAQSGFQQHVAYDTSNTNLHSGGYGSDVHTRLISATPVRIIVRPGTRVTIPVAAQTYDLTHGSTQLDQNSLNSDAEVLSNGNQRTVYRPGHAKHYESSYNYRKEWENHDTIPSTVVSPTPADNTYPARSELYEDGQASTASDQYDTRRVDSQRAHSTYGGYNANVKSTSGQSRFNYDTQRTGASHTNANAYSVSGYGANHQEASSDSSSNAYNGQSQYNAGRYQGAAADALTQAAVHNTGFNAATDLNSQVENLNGKPKSYQSAYSYHKSWERQGDPYVIKPASSAYYDGQSPQRLTTGSTQNLGYISTGSHYQHSHASGADCDENGHIRVARSYNTNQFQDMQQQSQSLEDFGQQSQNLEDFGQQQQSQNLDNFRQQQQSQNLEDFSQQQQSQNLEDFGQQSQNLEDFGQQQQSQNLEDFGQQRQNLEDFSQQHSQNLEDFGQQQQSQNPDNFGQQQQSQNLEDFGQQQQSQNLENFEQLQQSQNLENFSQQQQSQNLDNFGQQQQSQNLEGFGQPQQNLETFGQQQNKQNLEDLGQQTEVHWDSQQAAGQQAQSTWNNMQNTWDKLEDLGQKSQDIDKEFSNVEQNNQNDLGQHTQDTETELKTNSQGQQAQDTRGYNYKNQDDQQNVNTQDKDLEQSNKFNQQQTQPQPSDDIFNYSQQHNNNQMSIWDKFDFGSDQYVQQNKYNREHTNSNNNQVNWSYIPQQTGLDQHSLSPGSNPDISPSFHHNVNNGSTAEQITDNTRKSDKIPDTNESDTGYFNIHNGHFSNRTQNWNNENSFQETQKWHQSSNWNFANTHRQEQITNTDKYSHVNPFDKISPNTPPLSSLWNKLGNYEETFSTSDMDKREGNDFSQVQANTQNSYGNSMHDIQEQLNNQMKLQHDLIPIIEKNNQNKLNDTKNEKEGSPDVGRGDISSEDLSDLKPDKYPIDIPVSSETELKQNEMSLKNKTNVHHYNRDVLHDYLHGQNNLNQHHNSQEQKNAINTEQQNLHVFSLHENIEPSNPQLSEKQDNIEQQTFQSNRQQNNLEQHNVNDFSQQENEGQINLQDFGSQYNLEQQNLQDFGQQQNLQDFGQQQNLQDFGKQDNLEQQSLQDFGQQENLEQQNLQDFGKQDNLEQQNLQDFGQQVNFEQSNLQDFGSQDNLGQPNLKDFGQEVNLEQQNLHDFELEQNKQDQNKNFGELNQNLGQPPKYSKEERTTLPKYNLQSQNDLPPPEEIEQPIIKKQTNNLQITSLQTPSTEITPIEPVTESTGFWKSVGNKLSRAKSKIASWF